MSFVGEEWDSEEFNMALKVVLKVEIQSLLTRLAEAGEETVVLTACANEGCAGHLASSKAESFVNSMDIATLQDKFLNYVSGDARIPTSTPQRSAMSAGHMITPNVGQGRGNIMPQQQTVTGKRPLENTSFPKNQETLNLMSQGSVQDSKRRKVEPMTQLKAVPITSQLKVTGNPSSTASSLTSPQAKTAAQPITKQSQQQQLQQQHQQQQLQQQQQQQIMGQKEQSKSLKTTKVVSRSGGFTEERISGAEFQKFLKQYKPNSPVDDDDEEEEMRIIDNKNLPNLLQKANTIASKGPAGFGPNTGQPASQASKLSTIVSMPEMRPQQLSPNPGPSSAPSVKKDGAIDTKQVANMSQNVGATTPNKQTKVELKTESKLLKGGQLQSKPQQPDSSCAQTSKTGQKTTLDNLEDIENIDTETLIRMTKQKHFENMSEEEKQLQAKLGQLSSKLSWVVEYPTDSKDGKPVPQAKTHGQQLENMSNVRAVQRLGNIQGPEDLQGLQAEFNAFAEGEDYEEDDEEYDEDEEFNEEDLDEEDRETLRKMRQVKQNEIGQMGKVNLLGQIGNVNQMAEIGKKNQMGTSREVNQMGQMGEGDNEGFHMGMGYHVEEDKDYEEGYEDEEEEEYSEMDTEQVNHGAVFGQFGQGGMGFPQEEDHLENFMLMGVMARCQICNKIVRKTEAKQHLETHELEMDDDEEGEEEGEDPEEFENYMGETQDYTGGGMEGEFLEEGEFDEEGGEYGEEGEEFEEGECTGAEGEFSEEQGYGGEMSFTAEKLSAELLVAEKIPSGNDTLECMDDTVCELCHKKFASAANVKRHMLKVHNIGNENTGKVDGTPAKFTKKIKCPECEKEFATKGPLTKHLKKVHPDYNLNIFNEYITQQRSQKCSQSEFESQGDSSSLSHSVSEGQSGEIPVVGGDSQEKEEGGSLDNQGEIGVSEEQEDSKGSLDDPWKCGICFKEFSDEGTLSEHMVEHMEKHT
ncbi:uncharacterized protein LOC128212353 isoform X2 [Mya arenaria]|uniref:uncharacterized protein LOC128212353 isoform X2 n=1 Tax=Mya arenaria TaxID=6604 RepID=UPI0022E1C74B|nr:uncharacterized protein LOC128212353 isoform X2 [Mya arenaria]